MNAGQSRLQAGGYGGSGGQGGGSIWKKLFLITGLGCAVLVLVGALLMGLGVFRVATCCIEHGEKQEYMRTATYEFAQSLHGGDYDGAYEMLHESTQQRVTKPEFISEFEELSLADTPPLPVYGIHHTDREDENRWRASVDFAEPRSAEVIALTVHVQDSSIDPEAGSAGLDVDEWEIEHRVRDIEHDRYSEAAMNFHRILRQRNFEGARFRVSRNAGWRGASVEQFAEEMEPLVTELEAMQRAEVYGLYPEDIHRVRVEVLLSDAAGETYFIDYYVEAFVQGINSISEIRPAYDVEPRSTPQDDDPPVELFDEPDEADDEDPEGDQEADGEDQQVDEDTEESEETADE